jgi:hypothetical protein
MTKKHLLIIAAVLCTGCGDDGSKAPAADGGADQAVKTDTAIDTSVPDPDSAVTPDTSVADATPADDATSTVDALVADAGPATDSTSAADGAVPGNATCSAPQVLTLAASGPTVAKGDTTNVPDEFASVSCGNVNGPWPGGQLYYKVKLTQGKAYKVTLATAGWDGSVYAFPSATACKGADINSACAGTSSDQVGTKSEMIFIVPKVTGDWTIAVDSWDGQLDSGPFTLTIESGTPPANAVCAQAAAVTLVPTGTTITGDTSAFVTNENPKLSCGGKTPYTGPQLYYKVGLVGGKTYRIKVTSDFLAFFYVFASQSCKEADIEADCSSDGKTGDTMWVNESTPLELLYTAASTGVHHVAVDSWSGAVTGKFTIDISEAAAAPTFQAPFNENFEGDCKGLLASNDWECGTYKFKAGAGCDPSAAPPPAAHSGKGMWGTVLNDCHNPLGNFTGSSPTSCKNELPNDDSILRFKVKIPAGWTKATLTYHSWEDLYSNYDWAEVRVAGKAVSQICPGKYAQPTKWVKRTVDLTAHAGKTVEVAFHMMASTKQNFAGWYIDDLEVTGGP